MSLTAIPIHMKDANEFIAKHHRHHKPVRFHLFSIGCLDSAGGDLCGVAVVMRPACQQRAVFGFMCEVSRLATDGTKNACSFLLSRCARAAFEIGFKGIQTYTRADEHGASLRAAGWQFDKMTEPRSWNTARGRDDKTEIIARKRWVKICPDIVRNALKKTA